jgi:ParB-like chromosome segregation protein Spo0J
MLTHPATQHIELWPIERLVEYPRNPRKNDAAVDRMCASIREFGFKIPCLVRSDGEVVDGHLRLKAARKLGITEIPIILCDEWSAAQVKAFRLMVNRSVTWAEWDEELLALELHEIQGSDFDLSLTGFEDEEHARLLAAQDAAEGLTDEDAIPELPETPASEACDLWILGDHKSAGLWCETVRSFLADHGFVQTREESFAETMARSLNIGTDELRVRIAQGQVGCALLQRFEERGIATDNT